MMGKSHAKQGICGVAIGFATLVSAEFPVSSYMGVLLAASLLTVGGATFPDIDAEGSHATISYGRISHLLHSVTHCITQLLYHSTLGDSDRRKQGSHRLLTHTALGNLGAGAVLTALCYASPIVAAVSVGFLIGMAVAVWRKRWKWGAWFLGGTLAYVSYDPHIIWVWGVAFALGNMIHCFGDSCTLSGTPWFWPMMKKGRRWGAAHALPKWARFRTGTAHEQVALGLTYFLAPVFIGAILFIGSLI